MSVILYTEHTRIVNNALYNLLVAEFDKINVRYYNKFEPDQLAKNFQYLRMFYDSDTFMDRHSDGEFRRYQYRLSFYFDFHNRNIRNKMEYTITSESDHLINTVCEFPTYTLSGETIWFDAKVDREFIRGEDNDELEGYDENRRSNIAEMRHTLTMTKFCTMNRLAAFPYTFPIDLG